MFIFAFLVLLVLQVSAQGNPNDYVCENYAMKPERWAAKYPTNVAFNGIFRADGKITFFAPNLDILFAIPLNGSIWHQYYDQAGIQFGDLYLNGAGFGFPGAFILSSRQATNPIIGSEVVCQKFIAPSPTNLQESYSELENFGIGFMQSKYFLTNPATVAGRVFSWEAFNFDLAGQTATSQTTTNIPGVGDAHYKATEVDFRYTPISQADATALGWNPVSAPTLPAGKGFHAGRGAIPAAILNAQQKAQLGL